MKKLVKLIPVMIAIIMILSVLSPVFAVTNPSSLTGTNTTSFDNIGKRIIGMVQAIGSIVSVLVLVILGIKYMMGSAEVRVPIPFIDRLTSNSFLNNLRIAGFVDAGTIFSKTTGTYVYNKPGYAITAGVGLRVFIPGLGPINLDYGIPLTNTGGMDRKSGFFTFGMGEMY